MPLKKIVLAAAVAKYLEFKENGFTDDEIRAEIAKDEAAYAPGDITRIVNAINTAEATPDPADPEEEVDTAPDKPVSNVSKGLNRDYEEWQVTSEREQLYDQTGKPEGTQITGYSKIKKLRVTRLTERVADEINSQSASSNVRLYPI